MKLCARPLTTLSGGMQQRVAFARARAIELPQPRLPKDPDLVELQQGVLRPLTSPTESRELRATPAVDDSQAATGAAAAGASSQMTGAPTPPRDQVSESSRQRTEACRAPALGAVVGPVVG